ncbi:MAG TPA: ABC transporter substrate-binding protein, partial [Gemmatimonadaceae bacterium]
MIPSGEAAGTPAESTTSTPGEVRGAPRSGAAPHAVATDAAITIALTTLVEGAHAPWPRNSGERLLFAQLYEPLVRLDCTGAVVPGVARSWSRDSTSTAGVARWSFVLRGDALFGSGERVRAADVVSSWRASADAHALAPASSPVSAVASGARAVDDSTLVVSLPDSLVDLRAFASPQLAIARPSAAGSGSGSGWPDGTTSYYVDPTLERHAPDRPETHQATATVGLRARYIATPLLFQVEPDADGRDILDAGTDVLITASPSAVQYARTQASRATIPLPWTRSYVLVLPTREDDSASAGCIDADLRPLRDALALAVHADARGANGPCWWESEGSGGAGRSRPRVGSREILYPTEDATARELAERIVALAAPGRE